MCHAPRTSHRFCVGGGYHGGSTVIQGGSSQFTNGSAATTPADPNAQRLVNKASQEFYAAQQAATTACDRGSAQQCGEALKYQMIKESDLQAAMRIAQQIAGNNAITNSRAAAVGVQWTPKPAKKDDMTGAGLSNR